MKANLGGAFLLLLVFTFLSALPAFGKQANTAKHTSTPPQQTGNVPVTDFEQKSIVVEDLAAEVHSESGTITITAKIRNVSMAMIRGYATIHLLSSEGKRLLSYEEEINGGEALAQGATTELEITARVGNVKNVSSIAVDFTKT
ncbi:MAG: hypothetical protein V2B20_24230 [Pseudomonadota bacterium]